MNFSTYDPRTGTINCDTGNVWFVTEENLNNDQKIFFKDKTYKQQNVWISGYAGTGKSLMLVHAARQILKDEPNARLVIIVFTQSLVEMFKRALREMIPPLPRVPPVETYYSFMNGFMKYDYILCDEVQDLTPRVLHAMCSRAKHVVVAGDPSQSIYPQDPRWRERTLEPSQILPFLQGRDFFLPAVERFSETVIDVVKRFMSVNVFTNARSISSNDTKIYLLKASSTQSEIDYIVRTSKTVVERGYTVAVLLPQQKKILEFFNMVLASCGKNPWECQNGAYGKPNFGILNQYLAACGIPMQYVGSGYGTFDSVKNMVIVMTYHSAKGLDFDYVFLPFCNTNFWVTYDREIAKRLFMVAMTRVRMNLYITYTGFPHQYLQSFSNLCTQRTI
ncbi:MAG: AAA family ATPase [Desulfovibrionaceae bacterium]|nr:AAA family ATPase [Desulfovibrionaceae bacterium]